MGLQSVALHFEAALQVAIHRLEAAAMVLDHRAREVLLAVAARHEALGAGVQHVVLHQGPGNLGAAVVQAVQRVLGANVQMGLEAMQWS